MRYFGCNLLNLFVEILFSTRGISTRHGISYDTALSLDVWTPWDVTFLWDKTHEALPMSMFY